MLLQNFGGFTPSLPGIDIRFPSHGHLEHFEAAWGRRARPPLTDDDPDRMGLICVGTVIEHELRHFHDFLLNRDLLLTSWLRRRMAMNAFPAIKMMLTSTEFDVLPFPMIQWARLPEAKRAVRRAELAPYVRAGGRFWSPAMLPKAIRAPEAAAMAMPRTPAQVEEAVRVSLQAVRKDLETIEPLRRGLDEPLPNQQAFTPRFAYELSALNAQLHAVAKTYGQAEAIDFLGMLRDQGTSYSRLFIHAVDVLTGRNRPGADQSAPLELSNLSVVAFWCLTGCREDGTKGGPATRLATLLDYASDDWDAVFPSGIGPSELVAHLDTKMGCVPFQTSLLNTQNELEAHVEAAARLYGLMPSETVLQRETVGTYQAVLEARANLIKSILADPLTYIDPERWMQDLAIWPQCPVHMKFSAGRFGLPREDFGHYPASAQFNLTSNVPAEMEKDWVGDVCLQSFFTSSYEIPLGPVIKHQRLNKLVDLLIEPDGITPLDATALRELVHTQYGKELVQLI